MYAFPQKENKGTGVSGLKNSRDFIKTKRKAQRGQRNMRVYFSSREVPVGTWSWRRKISAEDRRKKKPSCYMGVKRSWCPKSQPRQGTTRACLHGLYRPKMKSH